MEDQKIIDLFLARDESALLNASAKYGAYLYRVANNIADSKEDTEECVNDTLLKAWNSIPPQIPKNLKAYLAKIARNLALDRFDAKNAQKRGGGQVSEVLDELSDCVAGMEDIDLDEGRISEIINSYIETLDPEKRKLFVGRYFYLDSIKTLSKKLKITESNAKTTLLRLRAGLKAELEKGGIEI